MVGLGWRSDSHSTRSRSNIAACTNQDGSALVSNAASSLVVAHSYNLALLPGASGAYSMQLLRISLISDPLLRRRPPQ